MLFSVGRALSGGGGGGDGGTVVVIWTGRLFEAAYFRGLGFEATVGSENPHCYIRIEGCVYEEITPVKVTLF